MARPRQFDTAAVLGQIASTFWADGYEATGISDLERATGLGRASLYAAYGPKQEMLHRSIDWYLDGMIEARARKVEAGGIDEVEEWFRDFAAASREQPDMARMGCLLVNSAVELGDVDAGVVARTERYHSRIQGAFEASLSRAVEQGDMRGDVGTRATACYLMLVGMFTSIRFGAEPEHIEALSRSAVDVIEAWREPFPS